MRKITGFTLVEMIITMVLVAIFAAGLGPYIVRALDMAQDEYAMSTVLSQGRNVMLRMGLDLRNTSLITAQAPNSITFRDATATLITYNLTANNLMRGGVILANNATSLAFDYYTEDGAVSTDTDTTCFIRIRFTLAQSGWSHNFDNTVWVRNATC